MTRNKRDQLKLPKLSRVMSGRFWVDLRVSELAQVHMFCFSYEMKAVQHFQGLG